MAADGCQIQLLLLLPLTHSVEQSLEKLIVSHLLRKLATFLENEGSVPCSQQPTTGSSPEPDVPTATHIAVVSANMLETLFVFKFIHMTVT